MVSIDESYRMQCALDRLDYDSLEMISLNGYDFNASVPRGGVDAPQTQSQLSALPYALNQLPVANTVDDTWTAVIWLLRHGADPDHRCAWGWTAWEALDDLIAASEGPLQKRCTDLRDRLIEWVAINR